MSEFVKPVKIFKLFIFIYIYLSCNSLLRKKVFNCQFQRNLCLQIKRKYILKVSLYLTTIIIDLRNK